MMNCVFAVDENNIVFRHTLLATRAVPRCLEVIALLCIGASRAAHLAALIRGGGAGGCCSSGRAPAKLAID